MKILYKLLLETKIFFHVVRKKGLKKGVKVFLAGIKRGMPLSFYAIHDRIIQKWIFKNNEKMKKMNEIVESHKDIFAVWKNQHSIKEKMKLTELTYGETPYSSMLEILKTCKVKKGDNFYDIGCGYGKFVFFSNIFFKCRGVGIDVVPEYIRVCNKVKEDLKLHHTNFLMKHSDEIDLKNADIVYICGTCFSKKSLKKLGEKLSYLRKGTKIISVANRLGGNKLKIFSEKNIFFPWGISRVFFYEVF